MSTTAQNLESSQLFYTFTRTPSSISHWLVVDSETIFSIAFMEFNGAVEFWISLIWVPLNTEFQWISLSGIRLTTIEDFIPSTTTRSVQQDVEQLFFCSRFLTPLNGREAVLMNEAMGGSRRESIPYGAEIARTIILLSQAHHAPAKWGSNCCRSTLDGHKPRQTVCGCQQTRGCEIRRSLFIIVSYHHPLNVRGRIPVCEESWLWVRFLMFSMEKTAQMKKELMEEEGKLREKILKDDRTISYLSFRL